MFQVRITLFFLEEQLYKNKNLDLRKKMKNKLSAKPGLLFHRTCEQSVKANHS